MPLTSAKFIITTTYGSASMIAYVIVAVTILQHRKRFSGSFFSLYLAQSLFNCITYLNTMITLRLPQNTCGDCLLAPFFNKTHFWGLEIFHTIHFHMGYTQNFMIAIVSANRLTMMLFPFSFEKYWRKITLPSILLAAFSPLLATSTIFLHNSSYYYVDLRDCFATRNSTDMSRFYKILIIFMVSATFISVILNIWTIFLLMVIRRLQNDKSTRKSEKMLVLHSFLNFVIELVCCLITVFNLYGVTDSNRDSWYAYMGQLLLPFVSASITLLSPVSLIMCCSALRSTILGGVFDNFAQVSSVVPSNTRSAR